MTDNYRNPVYFKRLNWKQRESGVSFITSINHYLTKPAFQSTTQAKPLSLSNVVVKVRCTADLTIQYSNLLPLHAGGWG